MVTGLRLLFFASLAAALPTPESSPIFKRVAISKEHQLESRAEFTILNRASRQAKPVKRSTTAEHLEIATLKIQETLPDATFRLVGDHYVGTNGVAHVHFKQTIDGIDVDNADFNVNILDDLVISFGNSFKSVSSSGLIKRDDIGVLPLQAFKTAVETLELPIQGSNAIAEASGEGYVISGVNGFEQDPSVKLAYIQRDGQQVLAWKVEADTGLNLMDIYVDAASDVVTGVIDHTFAATFQAYPLGTINPDQGSREELVDPEDLSTSPLGWLNDGNQTYTIARGNNIRVVSLTGVAAQSPSLNFSFPYSPDMTNFRDYAPASITQVFYTLNKFHDITYELGFDEPAGNFQVDNQGKGGLGNDAISVSIHTDTLGLLSVGADGRQPVMHLGSSGGRDVAFESTIVLHEGMHGVSARLTGGPGNTGCFSGFDGRSLTEGFSEFAPTIFRLKTTDSPDTNYTVGDWVMNTPLGLRNHFITTSEEVSPLYFADLNLMNLDLATIWAIPLMEIFWNMVETHGIGEVDSVTFDSDGLPVGARFLLLKLVLDSQALTPCRPHHLQARDALVQADEVLTGGSNRCAIWRGFAKRGFGTDAVRGDGEDTRVNGFAVPDDC